MNTPLPNDLENEKQTIFCDIHDAFAGVTRDGGTSWGQTIENFVEHDRWLQENAIYNTSEIIALQKQIEENDGPEPPKIYRPFHDQDKSWHDLVVDEEWVVNPDFGGFHGLDPIGIRYYLPAAMLRSLEDPQEDTLAYVLTLRDHTKDFPNDKTDWRDYFLEKWSALNDRQRHCVSRFLDYKSTVARATEDKYFAEMNLPDHILAKIREVLKDNVNPWERAYLSHWEVLDPPT